MAWWNFFGTKASIEAARLASKWKWESRKTKVSKRMALCWLRDMDTEAGYDWSADPLPMVDNKTRRQFILTFGDKEMANIVKEFRATAKLHLKEILAREK